MAGGAPAGIILRTGEEGCLINSNKIVTIIIHGKRRTAPRGTEMVELPFKRKGLRSNASLDARVCFDRGSFSKGRAGVEGASFRSRRINSIGANAILCQRGEL